MSLAIAKFRAFGTNFRMEFVRSTLHKPERFEEGPPIAPYIEVLEKLNKLIEQGLEKSATKQDHSGNGS